MAKTASLSSCEIASLAQQQPRVDSPASLTAGVPQLAGVGTPGWISGCGVFRGPIAPPPRFLGDITVCDSRGVALCDQSKPRGIFAKPFELLVPLSGGFLAPGVLEVVLFETHPCVLAAIDVALVQDAATGLALTADAEANMQIGNWRPGNDRQSYPSTGRDSEPPAYAAQVPEALFLPVAKYSTDQITDGLNYIPPKVGTINLGNSQLGVAFDIRNRLHATDVLVTGNFLINYGG